MSAQFTLSNEAAARRQTKAWYGLVAALALHVLDEATTGFLALYNPLVMRAREIWPWLPMPTFAFSTWLVGLIALIMVLALLGPLVQRGARGTLVISWALSLVMMFNGAGHLLGSVYFGRWLPGATSAPLLLLAASFLAVYTSRRARVGRVPTPGHAA